MQGIRKIAETTTNLSMTETPLSVLQSVWARRHHSVRSATLHANYCWTYDKAPEAELALRSVAIPGRQTTLASVLPAPLGIRLDEHIEFDDGEVACKLEGIVSKRKDSSYRSGRSSDWLKMKPGA